MRGLLFKMVRIILEVFIVIDVYGNVMIVYISYKEKFYVLLLEDYIVYLKIVW